MLRQAQHDSNHTRHSEQSEESPSMPHFIRNDIRIRHPERSRGISNQQQDASTGSA
ncbi:hypothetical protein THIOSC15_150007 [uncultured Thiomicrorhabdus sp.]